MLHLIVLAVFTLSVFIVLKRRLSKRLINLHAYDPIKGGYERLLEENKRLKVINEDLQNILDSTIALYDITKQICKSLDGDLVFAYFKEEMRKYIKVRDCQFLKGEVDLSRYQDYTIFPLKLQERLIGYLVVEDLAAEDREKFAILSQQFLLGIKRAILYQEVQESAIIDGLTGVSNRRYYLERFNEELERSKKFKYQFCCLMIDIDYFKEYNDHYGHIVGDAILRELARAIQENTRQIDLMGRYGGEEFSIVLSETDAESAQFAAERIRQAIEDKSIRAYDEKLKITVSIGISAFPSHGSDIKTLIDKADSALYRAKETGRNRVCVYEAS